jgi:hypothetical protein
VGDFEAALVPDCVNLRPSSWLSIIGMTLFLWMLIGGAFAVALLVVIFALPESIQDTARIVLGGICGAAALAAAVWWIASEIRENREKREQGLRVAYGALLLREAVLERIRTRCFYYPRSTVTEVFDEPIEGGGPGSPTTVLGHFCQIRFRDPRGKERTTSSGAAEFGGSTVLARVQKWSADTA